MLTSAWSDGDFVALLGAANRLGLNPADVLLVMTFESGLDPNIKNASGAYGLIQWTPAGYPLSGIRTRADIPSTVRGQIPLVERYFLNVKKNFSGVVYEGAGDLYQAVFAPGLFSRGRDPATVYYDRDRDPVSYAANSGLDRDGKGFITRADTLRALSSAKSSPVFTEALERLEGATGVRASPNLPGASGFEIASAGSPLPALLGLALGYGIFRWRASRK